TKLGEALLARLGDRGEEHRPGDALTPLRRGHPQPLVPDQPGRVGTESLHPDHAAVELCRLEGRPGFRDPVIENVGEVVVPAPDIFGDLDHACAVRRPDRPDDEALYARGCQCATPLTVRPLSKTKASPSRVSRPSSPARPRSSS